MDAEPQPLSGLDGARRLIVVGLLDAEGRILRRELAQFSDPDWRTALAGWRSHRTAALVWSRLSACESDGLVPDEIRGEFEMEYRRSVAHNLGLRAQAIRIIQSFRAADIPLVHLKGFHLAEVVHGDVGTRMIRDLDFLVPRADLAATETRLVDDGYGPAERPPIDVQCARHRHLVPFTHPHRRPVEIHWTVETDHGPFRIDPDELFERAVTTEIGGVPARVLAAEDLLLYLCLGAAYHDQFNLGLRAIADVAAVLRHFSGTLDWRVIVERSSRWRVTRCLHLTLRHARDLLGSPVPEGVLAETCSGDPGPEILDWSRDRIFVHEPDRHHVLSPAMARFAIEPSWARKVAIIGRSLFGASVSAAPPREPNARRRPAFFRYPRRWVRLWRERGHTMWMLLRRHPRSVELAHRVHRKRLLQDWLVAEEDSPQGVQRTQREPRDVGRDTANR